jgi:NADPH-dependent F420 reductase
MKIAVLGGTGKEGSGLALRWAKSGHDVTIGSRDVAKAQRVAEEMNRAHSPVHVSGADNLNAAQSAEVVVVTVPYSVHLDILNGVRGALHGKVLVDVTVPVNADDFTRVSLPPGGSAAKEAQSLLGSDVQVIAAFQNISASHLKKLGEEIECDVLVCGDSEHAKHIGMQLVKDAGMKGWDAGPLDNAVAVEGLTPILLGLNRRYKIKGAGIRITGTGR